MPRIAARAKPAAKKAPKAHSLAVEFPKGMVITDIFKKEWKLGDVIGKGGFGLIYLASNDSLQPVNKDSAENVIKIEPKGNGPLYCEMQFYQRAAKENYIHEFIKLHKLRYLSVPPYICTGLHSYKCKDYRFLVMPRFGTDLQHMLRDGDGTFPPQAVYAIGLRMVDALEYLHEKKYVHADIKAANILLGYEEGKVRTNKVYLVDFGLTALYTYVDVHKEYKEDPRKAHDGTLEFTSRDAHKGVAPSRRSDMEILGYCLLQWLSGQLPWEANQKDPNAVAGSKERYMQNIPSLISTCFSKTKDQNKASSIIIQKFLEEVNKLKYDAQPKYIQLRSILKEGLDMAGQKDEWVIDFCKPKKRKTTEGGMDAPVKKSKASSPRKTSKKAVSPHKKVALSQAPRRTAAKVVKPLGKKTSAVAVSSPQKRAALTGKKSPTASRGRSKSTPETNERSHASRSSRVATVKLQRIYSLPPPSKATPSCSTIAVPPKNLTRRRVKRVHTVQNDAAVQTSPVINK